VVCPEYTEDSLLRSHPCLLPQVEAVSLPLPSNTEWKRCEMEGVAQRWMRFCASRSPLPITRTIDWGSRLWVTDRYFSDGLACLIVSWMPMSKLKSKTTWMPMLWCSRTSCQVASVGPKLLFSSINTQWTAPYCLHSKQGSLINIMAQNNQPQPDFNNAAEGLWIVAINLSNCVDIPAIREGTAILEAIWKTALPNE
jgi:hypothetical protein